MSPANSAPPPSRYGRVVTVPAGTAGLAVLSQVVADVFRAGAVSALLPGYATAGMRERIAAALTPPQVAPDPTGSPASPGSAARFGLSDGAVVCPTSGSTGTPRGVILTRANLQASALATPTASTGGPPAWFTCLPPATVASLMCVVRGYESNMPVGIWSGAGASRPFTVAEFCADAQDFLARTRATGGAIPVRTVLVPTQAARLFEDPTAWPTLARFDAVVVGGGPISEGLVTSARRADISLVRSYGLTETCGGIVHDGWPLTGVRVTTLGDELAVAGPMVARSYLDGPLPTSGGYFRTGDRATIAPDGRVQVRGRLDEVVAVKGTNVDRAAIARVLRSVAGVHDCAVVALAHPSDGYRLVAYITGDATAADCQQAVAAVLGRVAVPEIREVPTLPTLPGGKVDLAALLADE